MRGSSKNAIAAVRLLMATAAWSVLPAPADAAQVSVTIMNVWCEDDCDEDGLESTLESTPDWYAKIWVNGQLTTTPRQPDDNSYVEPFWTAGTTVPDSQATFPVAIQLWDHDSTSGDDLADASPKWGKNNLELVVDRVTGKWSGDVNWPQSCVDGDGPDEPEVVVCFAVSIDSQNGDVDGDGLLDGWERHGFNADGDAVIDVDLPAMGANPRRQDLFLELDMEAGQGPSRAGIRAMKRAFAAAPRPNPDGSSGINLWVDTGGTVDPLANEAGPPLNGGPAATCSDGIDNNGVAGADGADPSCSGLAGAARRFLNGNDEGAVGNCGDNIDNDSDGLIDGLDPSCLMGDNFGGGQILGPAGSVGSCDRGGPFYTVKGPNFQSARRWIFRYGMSTAAPMGCPGGGNGELGGNDFIEYNHDAGTIMHELGHNLNLDHGGNEPNNCKPNYVSVMNYDHTFGVRRVGGGAIVDFSPPRRGLGGSDRGVAPLGPLVENALFEDVPASILDATDAANRFVFSPAAGNVVQRNLNLLPNWSNDAIDPPFESRTAPPPAIPIVGNINVGFAPDCSTSAGNLAANETLNGFHDWNAISLPFRQFAAAADGPGHQGPPEPSTSELLAHEEKLHRNDLFTSLSDVPDPVAAGTSLTYTAVAGHNGPNPASSVQQVLTFPAPLLVGAPPPGCTVAGPVVTCHRGEWMPGTSSTTTMTLPVPADLVYNNGGPLTLAAHATIADLTGNDPNVADNSATASTQVVAVADLAVESLVVQNPPVAMKPMEWAVVGIAATISSAGPSSPMDTALVLKATGTPGSQVNPTLLTTLQPRLENGEKRSVLNYVMIRCSERGVQSFRIEQSIRPFQAADSDPNAANNTRGARIEVDCGNPQ